MSWWDNKVQEEPLAKCWLELCSVISSQPCSQTVSVQFKPLPQVLWRGKKTFMLCPSDAGRQSSGGKGQRAASIAEADTLQESAPEMCLWSPKLGHKYLQSAENQHSGLVAEPKAYPVQQTLHSFFPKRKNWKKKKSQRAVNNSLK